MVKLKKSKLVGRSRSNKVRIILPATFSVVVLVIAGFGLFGREKKSNNTVQPVNSQVEQPKDEAKRGKDIQFDLAAVGDMLPHETVTQAAKTSNGYDYLSLIMSQLKTSFKKSPLRFCNQEAPSAASLGVRGYPAFNAPAQFPKDLSSFGCNLINTANNHANDQGQAGIDGTLQEWDAIQPLAVAGANRSSSEQNALRTFDYQGVKIGFTAFALDSNSSSANSYSLNMLGNTALLSSQIKELRKKCDLVIVSVHWGVENSHTVNTVQKDYAKKIADLGADVIIGTGPHVWQPYEEITNASGKTTRVWYSIGNGLNSQTEVDQLFSGVALLKITKTEAGVVTVDSPRVLPTYMHYTWSKGIGTSNAALLGRTGLKWGTVNESSDLISKRNDFQTTAQAQQDKLKGYLSNSKVQLIETY